MTRVKTGNVILKFTQTPLSLEYLLYPDRLQNSDLTSKQRQRYNEVYESLFYAGKGKSYTLEGKTKYYKAKSGFYTLRLPQSVEQHCKPNDKVKDCSPEQLGVKLGKASMNPTSAESGSVSVKSGGLVGRLHSYYVELGGNVEVLHIRTFDNEDLNYYGNRQRANDYESAVKRELKKQNVEPVRGASGSEYYESLVKVKEAIATVDKQPNSFIRDISEDEYEGTQRGANAQTRSKDAVVGVGRRIILISSAYKGHLKQKHSKYGAVRGKIMKKTRGSPEDSLYDVLFDDQVLAGLIKATIHIDLHKSLYNKEVEGGYVLETDIGGAKPIFRNAPKEPGMR
jgi:hypothetical protein